MIYKSFSKIQGDYSRQNIHVVDFILQASQFPPTATPFLPNLQLAQVQCNQIYWTQPSAWPPWSPCKYKWQLVCALPWPQSDDLENPEWQSEGVSARGQVDEDSGQAAGADGVEQAVPDAGDLGNVVAKYH